MELAATIVCRKSPVRSSILSGFVSMILKHWLLTSRFHKLILRSSPERNVSPSLQNHHIINISRSILLYSQILVASTLNNVVYSIINLRNVKSTAKKFKEHHYINFNREIESTSKQRKSCRSYLFIETELILKSWAWAYSFLHFAGVASAEHGT